MIDYAKWRNRTKLILVFLPALPAEPECLTPTEREVFWRIACGQPRKLIAFEMKFCVKTCEAHISSINRKIPGLKTSRVNYGMLAAQLLRHYE